jgi:hypothetical protein
MVVEMAVTLKLNVEIEQKNFFSDVNIDGIFWR